VGLNPAFIVYKKQQINTIRLACVIIDGNKF